MNKNKKRIAINVAGGFYPGMNVVIMVAARLFARQAGETVAGDTA
jgi:6-phosphofructokinase